MLVKENVSLINHTTFGVDVSARYFVEVRNTADVRDLLIRPEWKNNHHYFLGGGSNILFTKDYSGLLIQNKITGKEIITENEEYLEVQVGAGESWNDLVHWSVTRNLWGIENLVLIPGTVGASPVQNIGAYGQEAADTIVSVSGVDTETGRSFVFAGEQCEFAYRSSIFKEYPGRFIITRVVYRLSKKRKPCLEYGSIQKLIEGRDAAQLSSLEIAEIITQIRQSKLPSLGEIGMAGSFFKNPIISVEHYQELQKKYPEIPSYPAGDLQVKIPAGWIIEILGFKGVQKGNVGTYKKHALVLVNYGQATGSEVWDFAQEIITKTHNVFGINLEPEVIIL